MDIDFLRDINGKSIRKWWLIVITDIIIVLGLLMTFISYRCHWFDAQNNMYTSTEIEQTIEEDNNTSINIEDGELQNHNLKKNSTAEKRID